MEKPVKISLRENLTMWDHLQTLPDYADRKACIKFASDIVDALEDWMEGNSVSRNQLPDRLGISFDAVDGIFETDIESIFAHMGAILKLMNQSA